MYLAELIGVFLVGYGIWFAAQGIHKALGTDKDWWRPRRSKRHYPYPFAGFMLGICFVLLGARFALNTVWPHASILGYVGGGIFVLVVVIGVAQPRFLHPRWYGRLEDRFGREGVQRLKAEALRLEEETWIELEATETAFDQWVKRVMPQAPGAGRGFKQRTD